MLSMRWSKTMAGLFAACAFVYMVTTVAANVPTPVEEQGQPAGRVPDPAMVDLPTGSSELGHGAVLPVIIGPPLGYTQLVSVTPAGRAGNAKSFGAAVSGDGRYVAFSSEASDLVPGDTNGATDVFVRDLLTQTTTRVSVASDGSQAAYDSFYPSLSFDGRFVAFQSFTTDFVPNDELPDWDIFVHDRLTGKTDIVSVSASGEPGDSDSLFPVISGDGRFVAFESRAENLDGPNDDRRIQIFVHDRTLRTTFRVPSSTEHATDPAISYDGRHIAFTTFAPDLVPGDTNGVDDVFVYEPAVDSVERVSISSSGVQGDRASKYASLSQDGRYVAFLSRSTTLAPGNDGDQQNTDMYVHDRLEEKTARVGDGDLFEGMISGDGRYVVFLRSSQILLNEWRLGRVEVVSNTPSGENAGGKFPAISNNGNAIVFESLSGKLDPNDLNDVWDIYVHIRPVP